MNFTATKTIKQNYRSETRRRRRTQTIVKKMILPEALVSSTLKLSVFKLLLLSHQKHDFRDKYKEKKKTAKM